MTNALKIFGFCLFMVNSANAHNTDSSPDSIKAVFADLNLLKSANIPILYSDADTAVGYAIINGAMESRLSKLAHQFGRCGNYETLSQIPDDINFVKSSFSNLQSIHNKNLAYSALSKDFSGLNANPVISEALAELKSENIRSMVAWLSSYPTRYNRAAQPNQHVNDLADKLKKMVAAATYPVSVDLIAHKNTPQKSIRVSIKGSTKPDEFVIFGGHLDSINGWGGGAKPAPGADDNASGSASLYEALRVLLSAGQPKRSIEFFWYAGEESGLLGSAEIAETYKKEKKNVVSVLQLDMTMFPGDGEFKITSITDFTTPALRDYMKTLAALYLTIEITDDKCGYGCSDHASWYRRGFPTVFPTEAKFASTFQSIHTERDVISPIMSFEHSLVFSKIALAMALDLGSSDLFF